MLHWHSLREIRDLIQQGKVSSLAVTEDMLERAHRLNPELNCYQIIADDSALQQARAADEAKARGVSLGPLHGVPIALKDLYDTAGIATAAGMAIHKDRVPATDATVVVRLKNAGAVVLGKLTMTEGAFATHHPDITAPINPWGEQYWSGVSSSGSGVATAAGLCFGSLGTDTLGSIRFPSAVNGVTGLKPTWGRVSRWGVFPLAASMDHVGPMARSAEDCALLLGVLAGADPQDLTCSVKEAPDYTKALSASMKGMRIGFDKMLIENSADDDMLRASIHLVETLASLGADIVEITLPSLDQAAQDGLTHCLAEVVVSHESTYPSQKESYGLPMAAQLEAGMVVTSADLLKLQYRREEFTASIEGLFKDIDILVLPAMNVAAPSIEQILKQSGTGADRLARLRFTAPFNMSRHPTLTLPAGKTQAGAPVGVQIIGAHFDEARILAAGHAFQGTTDWHKSHPSI